MFRLCTLKSTTMITTRQVVVLDLGKCPRFIVTTPTSSSLTTTTLRRRLSSNSSSSSSSGSSTSSSSGSGSKKFQTEAERNAFLRQANATMEQYHNARQLMKKGKLPRHASHPANNNAGAGSSSSSNAGTIQMAVVGVFLVAFLATPYLGKRIAQDDEFRKRYIPTWYDYTIKQPDFAWTREELHEQRLQVEAALRQRAAAGDFEPDKLHQLQKKMMSSANDADGGGDGGGSNDMETAASTTTTNSAIIVAAAELTPDEQRRAMWDRWHPGLADDEKVNEEE